ncbi:MAG TPA: ATP-dependent Clp protease ATP-binding subunit [Candidatus Saccharimonadales bacterium]|jgi:ATP-dependent Clp protease ATP-binding subunit ClpC
MDSMQEFLHRLTENARGSIEQADMIARSLGSAYIGTEHLLLGVLSQDASVGAKLLADVGVTLDRAKVALNLTPRTLVVSTGAKGLSETAKLTLRMSWDVAQEFHQDYCGTEHILFSILSQKNARATVLLRDMNVSVEELLGDIEGYLNRQQSDAADFEGQASKARRSRKHQTLNAYGTDLTAAARAGELDPVIGRNQQIARMVTILSRRTKNNPILIGEPGVGKTAIVEGLAQLIAREDVPDHLLDKHVYQLDLAAMIAGTKYRGEFEERLKKVVEELTRDDSAIVFIDELHLLIGAGAAEGAMDAANMLKPALARGKLRMIGATTLDEYRKHIEKDAAFERRLQPIVVEEPNIRDSEAILEGMREKYEQHHSVKVPAGLIEDVVYLADRYISERFMPDKALDVLDEATSLVRVRSGKTPSKAREYQRELRGLNEKMEDAVSAQDYERAALYKMRISRVKEKLDEVTQPKSEWASLSYDDVASAVATMSGVPVQHLKRSEANLLRRLEKHLAKHLVGQQEAVTAVARAVRRGRSGVASSKRPIGSFIFMGPTGVGKTELARVLAREVFGSDKSLIKIDMSEFGERHTTSRLVGAPAGYVGYDDGGQLTDKIRRQPYSVVLLDEIEKAHPDVFQLLLQLLEDGTLTDAKGRQVDFSNTIIILTSNLGADRMRREADLGFGAKTKRDSDEVEALHSKNRSAAIEALERMMRPELINRFDDIIVFRSLTRTEVGRIFDLLIDELNRRLGRKGIGVSLSASAKRWFIDRGYDAKNGARPLRRVIQNELEHAIADGLLSGAYGKGDLIRVNVKGGKLDLSVTQEQAHADAIAR